MQDTQYPFALGSNIMISIKDGIISQLTADCSAVIKTIPVASLTEQQATAINAARVKCHDAMIAQGFKKA
jgi:hypothetical protein